MRKLLVLGPRCGKCNKLAASATLVAEALGLDYELEKVTDLQEIMTFGVMATPALVVDGEVKVVGRVPSIAELRQMLA